MDRMTITLAVFCIAGQWQVRCPERESAGGLGNDASIVNGAAGLTLVEKVFARASALAEARAGEILYPDPDLIVCIDMVFAQFVEEALALGAGRLAHPERTHV